MRSCHEIFAVTRIDRATTDVGVKDIISRCDQRPVRVVCTHSEVMNPLNLAVTSTKMCLQTVNARETEVSSPVDAPRIKKLRSEIDPLATRLKQLQKKRRQNKGEVPSEELRIG
jgi:hypothetical protein